jgi:hypothetical protein
MAETLAQIRAKLVTEWADKVIERSESTLIVGSDGTLPGRLIEIWEITGDDREALLDQWAQNQLEAQAAAEAEVSQKAIRKQVVQAIALLDAMILLLTGPPAPTAAQVRDAVIDLARVQRRLIRVLVDRGLIEPESS